MDCTRARALLWPPERPRLVGGDVGGARTHVQGCEDCVAYFAQDRALLDLYDRARRVSAPMNVRERVFDALAGERLNTRTAEVGSDVSEHATIRTRLRRYGAWPAAIATVAITVLSFSDFGTPSISSVEAPDVFVEDYLRRAVGQDHIETNDPAEVTRFLQRELGLRVQPLQFAGLDLERAEICLLEGRRGAMIVYKKDGAVVSHYLVPREDAQERPPALSQSSSGDAALDMPVVTWASARVEQALVGEVDSALLMALAEENSDAGH